MAMSSDKTPGTGNGKYCSMASHWTHIFNTLMSTLWYFYKVTTEDVSHMEVWYHSSKIV